MKVTYNWLKDFVDLKISPEKLADKLTMAGIEVKECEFIGGDYVFEIEITSNRPDWLSVIGLAREVAAITGAKLKIPAPKLAGHKIKAKEPLSIIIEDKSGCPIYTGKIIRGVKVGPSPDWLKKRLELVGCRSINNVVDITNYVLFEFGQPLHAFDLDKLAGPQIIIRRAKSGEKITTIDNQERVLTPDILVIADEKRPVAAGGVMGGKDTEVSEKTINILLESALFNPLIVRRSRYKLGIQSEASYRFERGVDSEAVELASIRAVELIKQFAGGSLSKEAAAGAIRSNVRVILFDLNLVEKILAVKISLANVKDILTPLGFKVYPKNKASLKVEIPSYRQDVKLPEDLIEEVARVYGYENIPTSLPRVALQEFVDDRHLLLKEVRGILNGLGLNEVLTYSLVDRDILKGFGQNPDSIIQMQNPLSEEQEILRPSLQPSLSQVVSYNLRQKQNQINIFEIAKIYSNEGRGYPKEDYSLGIALCGVRFWLGEELSQVKDEAGFLHLKGIIESLLEKLGIAKQDYKFTSEGKFEVKLFLKDEKLAVLKRLPQEVLDALDIKNKEVFLAEIALDKILALARPKKKFTVFPRFPGIERDISLVLKDNIFTDDVTAFIKQQGGDLLSGVEITNFYRGRQIPEGFKNLTISCVYCSPQRTLNEDEVNSIHTGIIEALLSKFQARIR